MSEELATYNAPIATVPQSRPPSLKSLLDEDSVRKRFEDVLGKKAPGFISSILSAVSSNKKLREANHMSVIQAAAIAASLDLPINPSLGFAHIVPYGGQAQFQLGWRGYVQLAMRTGQYKTVNVSHVCEGELVRYDKFTGEMVFDSSKKTSDVVAGYVAYFRLINGFEKFLYMTAEETAAHGKRYSVTYGLASGKWKTDFEAMSLKTVLKMLLSKYGILSIDMQTAIQADQAIVYTEGEYAYDDNPETVDTIPADTTLVDKLKAAKVKKDTPGNYPMPPLAEMAPGECPDRASETMTKAYCDGICKTRLGCPVWEVTP
jgi:recombination protein RecT